MSRVGSISVVVVEDEHLARARAVKLVREHRELVLLGEAATGPLALQMIERHRPDLVLMDIALPELNAFEVLAAVGDPLPVIVFMTAFDDYATKAFEIDAVDYLLKPIERERFEKAIEHAHRQLLARRCGAADDLLSRLAAGGLLESQRLLLRNGDRVFVVAPRDIDWIISVGNYVKVYREGVGVVVRQTMATLEQRLRGDGFVRIQRSILVNAAKIVELGRQSRDAYFAVMADGTRLRLGERYRDNLKSVFRDL